MSEEQVMEPALTKASSLKEMEVPKDLWTYFKIAT